MATMTKREGAQRILDAHASSLKLKGRMVAGIVVMVLAGLPGVSSKGCKQQQQEEGGTGDAVRV